MPDFDNFRRAVLCQGEPKRVPQFDGTVDADIKSEFLGRPILGLEDEVDFQMGAGYDYVPLTLGFRQTIRGETRGIMGARELETAVLKPHAAQYKPAADVTQTRLWAEQGAGLIVDDASFDAFEWPDPDTAYSYDTLERLGSLLPDGAMAIVNVGYIFSAPWMLMGLEHFCMALAAGDALVHRVIERVARTQQRVVENVLQFDCVGAIRMPDDLAYTESTIIAPRFYREYIFPWHKRIGKMVHAKRLLYMFHSDGRLYEVIDDLIDCGFPRAAPLRAGQHGHRRAEATVQRPALPVREHQPRLDHDPRYARGRRGGSEAADPHRRPRRRLLLRNVQLRPGIRPVRELHGDDSHDSGFR